MLSTNPDQDQLTGIAAMKRIALPALFILISAVSAEAHTGNGISSGFLHPFLGIDHIIAMVAVGAWGALLGGKAVWALPLAFISAMAAGGMLGAAGVAFPFVEIMIAASMVVLGLLAVGRVRLPLWSGLTVVSLFALAHGHAHGTEMPAAADPLTFAAGFVAATALLHAAGILIAKAWASRRSAHV
jgi:urease accessory protein